MSEAACLSEVPVTSPKQAVRAPPVTDAEGFRAMQLGELSSVRAHLEATGGVLVLECGCFMRVHPEALKTLPMQKIVDALCETMGCCAHRHVQH